MEEIVRLWQVRRFLSDPWKEMKRKKVYLLALKRIQNWFIVYIYVPRSFIFLVT